MKLYKYISRFIFFISIGSMIAGCSKLENFGDTNVNPNGSSEVLTSGLLTSVESLLAGNGTTIQIAAATQPGLYCQYFAEPTYPGLSLYTQPQINSVAYYFGPLMDCQLIINKNTDPATSGLNSVTLGGANENQIAVAKILKSYIFWTITDRWGDMPYSEALKGVELLSPAYDPQEQIYKSILSDLKSSVDGFVSVKPTVTGDIIYSGNIGKWKRMANSLRMLVALRLSKKNANMGGFAAREFFDAANDPNGTIESNADNFTLFFPGGNYRNPWNTIGGSTDNGVAKTFTDVLSGLSDNRITMMASNTNGVPYGLTSAAPTTPAFSLILAPSAREDNSPLIVIGAASVWLAKAEAIELGWIQGDSKEAYEKGVRASFEQWGVIIPPPYLTTGPANFESGAGVSAIGGTTVAGSSASTPTKRARIALQQWIAYYPDGIQGWSNWRRTEGILPAPASGVPDLKPTVNAKNLSGKIVRRFVYGVSEYSLNGDKVKAAAAAIPGGDDQDSRVWWDRN
jgi:hypothetical protein